MPKPRTKRSHIREERKRKRYEDAEQTEHKRHKHEDQHDDEDVEHEQGHVDKEFFGMLADEEQEYFRRADEMLGLNQFPSAEERDVFLRTVFREARGKELKLASSQSCSRLMERLIQLGGTARRKTLFEAFAGHFPSLVRHRFASHCCEALFLRSAGAVTQELAGFVVDTKGAAADEDDDAGGAKPEASMESLFLATLDELEDGLGYLVTDRFASHTLRVLLLVLSGRPLEDSAARIVKSRKKESVSVVGSSSSSSSSAAAADDDKEQLRGERAVPASFTMAANKIIRDATAGMDATALRVLAKHPIGNPTLQLLLELDLTLKKKKTDGERADAEDASLLHQLLPGAPASLADASSEATEFINGMIYDPIGSRLVETLVAHAPGRIFKALNQNVLLPRIHGYVRNDISCYPAIKALSRLSREDLVRAVSQIAPTVPDLVNKSRFNVLKTLVERCAARGATHEIKDIMKGIKHASGPSLVLTLCPPAEQPDKKTASVRSHGAALLTALLAVPGPSKAVHASLLSVSPETLATLASTSMATVTLLTTALKTPSQNSSFQKSLTDALHPHMADLAASQFGHNLVNALAALPSRGKDMSIPPHKKDAIMGSLAARETALRESWMGRSVWRTWKGDMWKTRRGDWKAWMKNVGD